MKQYHKEDKHLVGLHLPFLHLQPTLALHLHKKLSDIRKTKQEKRVGIQLIPQPGLITSQCFFTKDKVVWATGGLSPGRGLIFYEHTNTNQHGIQHGTTGNSDQQAS